jgi:hypothetical protein
MYEPMKRRPKVSSSNILKLSIFLATGLFCFQANAQQFVYPSTGQSPEQQQTDEGECYIWARGQTGYDPANPPKVSAPPPPQKRRGGVARGALRGAAIGEIVDDDPGKGAAIGAVLGGARQANKTQEAQAQQQADMQYQQSEVDAMLQNYNRARGVCLEGRGYTVK